MKGLAVGFVITAALVLAPTVVLVGIAAAVGIGCVIISNVPEESVPSWLKWAKSAADIVKNEAVKVMEDGPVVLVEDIGQGLMDEAQTPEGIASTAGSVVGSIAGGHVGKLIKAGISVPKAGAAAEGGNGSLKVDELVTRDSKFLDADGKINWDKWAPNGGRVTGTIKEGQTLSTGTIIDRYGNKYGKYTSPVGVPYEQRALPYVENPNAYHKYEVIKPIDNVTISEIAGAFEQPGGGIQYELPSNIKQLLKDGYIKEIH